MHARVCAHVHTSQTPSRPLGAPAGPLSAIRVCAAGPPAAPQHLESTWPGRAPPGPPGPAAWGAGLPRNQTDTRAGARAACGASRCWGPCGRGHPTPLPGASAGPGPARLAARACSGRLPGARPPPSRAGLDSGSGARERRGRRAPPGAPEPHTTETPPMVLTPRPGPAQAPRPRGRRQLVPVQFYCTERLSLYYTPLNGVNFLIIYIKIKIYKYI